jgi:hypothetical protein
VDRCDDLLLAWLEKCEFYVGKGNVDGLSFHCAVSETIYVTFQDTLGLFLANTRSRV